MMQLKSPRIKRHVVVIPHNENEVELKTGIWNATSLMLRDDKEDNTLSSIVIALNGEQSIGEIAQALDVSRSEIEGVIDHLGTVDMIEQAPANTMDYYLDMMPLLTVNREAKASNEALTVSFIGEAQIFELLQPSLAGVLTGDTLHNKTDEFTAVLAETDDAWLHDGLMLEQQLEKFAHWQNDFVVVVSKVINPVMLAKFNRIAHALQIPWIHAALDGPFIFVGPTIQGTAGPCFECFEQRVTMNLRESAPYLHYKKSLCRGNKIKNELDTLFEPINQMLCAHVAMEVSNFICTRHNFTQGKVLSMYLPTMEISYNPVLQFSGCRTCGANTLRDENQLYFEFESLLGGQHEH